MNDNDIIKVLECCKIHTPPFMCEECPLCTIPSYSCAAKCKELAYDLINRQKAEIERLKRYDEERDVRLHARLTETARVEAIKEFTERLHEKLYTIPSIYNSHFGRMVDNLVKEMTEE